MSFEPAVILRLINLNALVSAAACTKKVMDFDKFASALTTHNDVELARAESVYFNTMLSWGEPRKIRQGGGFITAAAVGMAVCLIKKQALKIMVEEGAVEQRLDVYEGKKQTSWGFFDYTKHQGMNLTEDYAFCYRWTHVLGRPLWVCTDGAVDHIGDFHYGGNYSLVFKDQIRPTSLSNPDDDGNAQHDKASSKVAPKRRKSPSHT